MRLPSPLVICNNYGVCGIQEFTMSVICKAKNYTAYYLPYFSKHSGPVIIVVLCKSSSVIWGKKRRFIRASFSLDNYGGCVWNYTWILKFRKQLDAHSGKCCIPAWDSFAEKARSKPSNWWNLVGWWDGRHAWQHISMYWILFIHALMCQSLCFDKGDAHLNIARLLIRSPLGS